MIVASEPNAEMRGQRMLQATIAGGAETDAFRNELSSMTASKARCGVSSQEGNIGRYGAYGIR